MPHRSRVTQHLRAGRRAPKLQCAPPRGAPAVSGLAPLYRTCGLGCAPLQLAPVRGLARGSGTADGLIEERHPPMPRALRDRVITSPSRLLVAVALGLGRLA